MDMATVGAAIALMKGMPDNAAASAAKAEAAADRAETAASSVESATAAETKTYLGIT